MTKLSEDRLPAPTFKHEFFDALRDIVTLALPVLIFGMVFGAASITGGFSALASFFSSATIFAGASQLVFIEIYGASVLIVALTILAINFRHVLYSAAIGRRFQNFSFWQKALGFFLLTDLQFAAGEMRAEKIGYISAGYYLSFGLLCFTIWMLGTGLGVFFGAQIDDPARYGIDFILPIYFLIILMGFKKRASFIPVVFFSAAVSVAVFLTIGSPWNITIGGVAGILLAAFMGRSSGSVSKAIGDEDPNAEAGK